LGARENILAVLEYTASGISPGPADPTLCFENGMLKAGAPGCADQLWQAYLKNSASDLKQPFLMLIPPSFAPLQQARNTSGIGILTRQIVLPLAGLPDAKVFQLSRISGRPALEGDVFEKTCNPEGNTSAQSALCVGVVFHSLTFTRM
jgi:hypothetical protein